MPFKSEERADTKVWRLELAWNGAQGNAVGDGIPEAAGDGTQVLQGLRRHLACDGSHLGVLRGGSDAHCTRLPLDGLQRV